MTDQSEIMESSTGATRSQERRAFIFLTVFLAPILSVVIVGGLGFIIWMSHLIFGPPNY